MLRTLTIALVLALPGIARAEPAQTQFPQSAIGAEVRGAQGVVLGRVASVERNAAGEIVAAVIPGLEPEDAPREMVLAEVERQPQMRRARDERGTAIIRASSDAARAR